MTVEQLIEKLNAVEDKNQEVGVYVGIARDGGLAENVVIEHAGKETLGYGGDSPFHYTDGLKTLVVIES